MEGFSVLVVLDFDGPVVVQLAGEDYLEDDVYDEKDGCYSEGDSRFNCEGVDCPERTDYS